MIGVLIDGPCIVYFSEQVLMLCSDVLVAPKDRQILLHELMKKMNVVIVIYALGLVSYCYSDAICFRFSSMT